jgi:hypothetical protein
VNSGAQEESSNTNPVVNSGAQEELAVPATLVTPVWSNTNPVVNSLIINIFPKVTIKNMGTFFELMVKHNL